VIASGPCAACGCQVSLRATGLVGLHVRYMGRFVFSFCEGSGQAPASSLVTVR
jgi:hypothetical protein